MSDTGPATLLPPNATELETGLDRATAARLESIPHLIRSTANSAAIPAVWLPWLAWGRRVENWSADWSETQKRQSIKASYEIHRRKGTIGAMRSALYALNVGLRVIEWWEESPRQRPYTFRLQVSLDTAEVTPSTWQMILNIVNTTKNVRSWMTSADLIAQPVTHTYQAAAASYGLILDIPAA